MVNLEKRVNELERQVRELTRLLTQAGERLAKPLAPQNGWYLGVLGAELNQGSSASVDLYVRDVDTNAWTDTEKTVTALDWFLNDGESVPVATKVWVAWYVNAWVIMDAYCVVSDNTGAPEE